ncbi:peptidoglycan-binding domain-containing protein [Streptomyces koyangensis]|uniref:peptidoglycan-binding domain-containing protein n=1 Tax=Streptomyces koyangensis TaxID=188770 RepID=UPI003C2B0759
MKNVRKSLVVLTATVALFGGSVAVAGTASAASAAPAAAAENCRKTQTVGWYCGHHAGRTVVLAQGSKGAAVREVQALIANTTAYYAYHSTPLNVDGDYGPATRAAVRWFQGHYMGSGHVDGVVGPNTWNRLRKV